MKISEKKALEAYPIKIDRIYYGLPLINGAEPFTDDVNIHQRNAYIKGYDKAMQDIKQYVEELIRHEEKEWGEHNVDFGLYTIIGHIVEIEENE